MFLVRAVRLGQRHHRAPSHLALTPHPQPFLVGSITVSVGSSFPVRRRRAFSSVLSRFYLVVWLKLKPPDRPCSPSSAFAYPCLRLYDESIPNSWNRLYFLQCEQMIICPCALLFCRDLPGHIPFMVISHIILHIMETTMNTCTKVVVY